MSNLRIMEYREYSPIGIWDQFWCNLNDVKADKDTTRSCPKKLELNSSLELI
jgi:hypothetical protein